MTTADEDAWLDEGRGLLRNYFKLEDPRGLAASRLEWWVEYELPDIHLRGIIDRVEERADGSWILTDYKTGRIPGESRELSAFFGLRFYALVCWRAFGVIPKEIRLVYLGDPAVLTLNPNERMLIAFERQMQALGKAIARAVEKDDWRTRPSPFCMSCSFQTAAPPGHRPSRAEDDSSPSDRLARGPTYFERRSHGGSELVRGEPVGLDLCRVREGRLDAASCAQRRIARLFAITPSVGCLKDAVGHRPRGVQQLLVRHDRVHEPGLERLARRRSGRR